jgi:hypothetical protein
MAGYASVFIKAINELDWKILYIHSETLEMWKSKMCRSMSTEAPGDNERSGSEAPGEKLHSFIPYQLIA